MKRNFDTLDGLRGIAALAVITCHSVDARQLQHFLPAAYLAVDFFFALSGFVLAHAYGQRLSERMSLRAFMRLRLIRLWPFYALGTVVTALIIGVEPLSLAAGLVFLPMLSGAAFPLNPPALSLFAELVANTVYGLVGRHLTNKRLCCLLVVSGAALAFAGLHYGTLDRGDRLETAGIAAARVAYGFFAGVGIYRLWTWRAAPKLPVLIFPVILIGLFMAQDLELVWALVGLPALVYFAASAEPKGAVMWACKRLGVASYGVYVIQTAAFHSFKGAGIWIGDQRTVMLFAGLFCLALLLDAAYDRPVRQWLSIRNKLQPATIPAA